MGGGHGRQMPHLREAAAVLHIRHDDVIDPVAQVGKKILQMGAHLQPGQPHAVSGRRLAHAAKGR